ncbi:hypothetical protein LTR36_005719 [Oleoguttula mirabilis]|uniref:Transcription elongation factor Eaf N-terminal domain-containing protein n=1 Tax=Oleoguttula mirabilis TaxID=1507867 RepID=A0AAV9JDC7_9PEZI|nr:hypothetical protein LTR36_005719 [Oleoguttula mirabilis]
MAAAVSAAQAIDLATTASYPIRLGASITKPADSRRQYTSIRYNHKPQLRGSQEVKATISARTNNETKLRVRQGGAQYGYDGERVSASDSYVLVLKGVGKEQEAVLEKVGTSHVYNLVSAPEAGHQQLAERYPHTSLDEDEDDSAAGDEDAEEGPADPSNPYDYRHFLKAAVAERARRPNLEAPRSTANTPLVQPRAATTTPISRPAKRDGGSVLVQPKKRKPPAAAAERPNVKRAKASQEAPPPTPADTSRPRAKTEAPLPKIRVDRKASLRRPSYDDSGELILENETPVSDKKLASRQNAMSLALSGQLGHQGPISLRTAANSPASQIASPMPLRPEGPESDAEFEFGGSESPPDDGYDRPGRYAADDDDGDADEEDEDEDADVEDLELPSPAAEHKPSVSAATVTAAGDEDDLDAQLAAAMAEEEDGPVDEEEESEEE